MAAISISSEARQELALAAAVAGAAAMAVYLPLPFFGVLVPVLLLVLWFAQRRLVLFGVTVFMVVQGALEIQVAAISEAAAELVRHADEALIVGLFVLLVGEHLIPRMRLPSMPAILPMALFCGVALLSGLANDVPLRDTLFGTFMLAKNWVWFALFASLTFATGDYHRVFRLVVGGLLVLMALGFIQFATGPLTYDLLSLPRLSRFGILRVEAVFTHPLYYASAMALLTCIAMGAYLYLERPRYLWLVAAGCLAAATTLAVKSLLGLVLAVVVVMAVKRFTRLLPLLVIGLLITVALPQYTIANVQEQFDFYLQDAKTTRAEGYRVGLDILRDHPLLGAGPSRYGGYASMLLESPIYDQYNFVNYDGNPYDTVESYWPNLFGETGLLGFACFVWVFVAILRTVQQRLRNPASSLWRRSLCFAAIPMIIVTWTEAFAAANFSDTTTGFILYGFLGLACSRQEEPDEAQ